MDPIMKKHLSYNEGDGVVKAIVATVIFALVASGVVYIILRRNMKTESGPLCTVKRRSWIF